MSLVFLLLLLIPAAVAGIVIARPVAGTPHGAFLAALGAVGSVGIVAAIVVTAESADPLAHYLGLAAVFLGAMAIVGSIVLAARLRTGRERP